MEGTGAGPALDLVQLTYTFAITGDVDIVNGGIFVNMLAPNAFTDTGNTAGMC